MYKAINCGQDKVVFLGAYSQQAVDDVLFKQIGYYARKKAYIQNFGDILRYCLNSQPFSSISTVSVINSCVMHILTAKRGERKIK